MISFKDKFLKDVASCHCENNTKKYRLIFSRLKILIGPEAHQIGPETHHIGPETHHIGPEAHQNFAKRADCFKISINVKLTLYPTIKPQEGIRGTALLFL